MGDVDGNELARKLIDEGARLLAEEGAAGLSLRKLAGAAGTSTMAIYSLFGDKAGLLSAMHREGFRRLGERLRVTGRDAATTLVQLGQAYRISALESPALYGLMFGAPPPGFEPSEGDAKAADATFAPLVEAVRAAIDEGVLAGEAERIALQLWVVAHGMVGLELAGHLPFPPEQAGREFDAALLLAAEPFLTGG